MTKQAPQCGGGDEREIDDLRRDALEKLGRLGAAGSTGMLTLLLSGRASAQSVLGPPPDPPEGP
jgi:hypothetical protein